MIGFVALLASGCATEAVLPKHATEVPPEQIFSKRYLNPADDKQATLTFVRDSGMLGAGVTIHLFVDGEDVAGFRPSERLQISMEPGEYLIGVQSRPNFGLEQFIETPIRVEASKKYSFRIGIDYNKAIVQRTSAF